MRKLYTLFAVVMAGLAVFDEKVSFDDVSLMFFMTFVIGFGLHYFVTFENIDKYAVEVLNFVKNTASFETLQNLFYLLRDAILSCLPFIEKVFTFIGTNAPKVLSVLGGILGDVLITVIKISDWAFSKAGSVASSLSGVFGTFKDAVSSRVLPVFTAAIDGVVPVLTNLWEIVKKIASPVIDFFKNFNFSKFLVFFN